MCPTIRQSGPAGRVSPSECPEEIELVTGGLFTAYRSLTEADELFDTFVEAWRRQDEWDWPTFRAFWHLGLRLWPRTDGQVRRDEARAVWVYRWRQFGCRDEAIAQRIGVELDSLRRQGILSRADEISKLSRSRSRPRARVRAPRVLAVDREQPPLIDEVHSDPQFLGLMPVSVARARQELERAYAAGPPRE